uniref:Uncharacterized protein n=1 Tax=Aegilops tauschii TaxID=37682 RepID=N1QW47_AEGTA
MVVAEAESSDLGGELGAALGTTGTINKARRTKAIPVVQRAPSVRAKAKLGDLSSLESAKLRIADKNMDAAGRKPANKQATVVAEAESSDLGGELGASLGTTGTINKARRTKAIPVVQRAPSVRAKAKLGDLSSLESAKLRIADKNMDAAGTVDLSRLNYGAICLIPKVWAPLGKKHDIERMKEAMELIKTTMMKARHGTMAAP